MVVFVEVILVPACKKGIVRKAFFDEVSLKKGINLSKAEPNSILKPRKQTHSERVMLVSKTT